MQYNNFTVQSENIIECSAGLFSGSIPSSFVHSTDDTTQASQKSSRMQVSQKSKGIKKDNKWNDMIEDNGQHMVKRCTALRIKQNRIPLNKLLLKKKTKKAQNFLFSPNALERSQSKINLSLMFQETGANDCC